MPSLIGILGGDMTQLKTVFDSAKEYAARTGSAIRNSMTVSLAKQSGSALKDSIGKSLEGLSKPIFNFGGEGKSGAIRETLVILREIGRGNWSRVPGSLSILTGQLGILPMLLSPLVLIPAAIVAGLVGIVFWTKKWGESLTALKWPEFNPEHIAKNLQKSNQMVEAQKQINEEIEKTKRLYDGAAEAAKRVADVTKDHFDHLRKMNQLDEQAKLAGVKSEKEKDAIREAAAKKELDINSAERAQVIKNKQDESNALKKETEDRKNQAEQIVVPSKQHDEELLKQKKKNAEEAAAFLAKTDAEMQTDREREAQAPGQLKLPTRKAYEAQRETDRQLARDKIKDEKQFADQVADNDEKRKRKEELIKEAASSAGKSVEAGGEAQRLAAEKIRKDKEESEEAAAKLKAEEAKTIQVRPKVDANSLQRIGGAYSSAYDTSMINVTKQSEQHLKEIKVMLAKQNSGNHAVSDVRF